MSRSANLSPMGLYNWDQTIFDLMVIPEALDRETLIENLLLETAELEVLYTSPVTFRYALGQWSKKNLAIWERLYATTQYEYNPINNYDRTEEGSDGSTQTITHSGTDTHTATDVHSGSDTRTGSSEEGGSQGERRTTTTEEGGEQGEHRSATIEEGGTEELASEGSSTLSGTDTVTADKTSGHWVAGFDAPTPTQQNDGLVKQTRDEEGGTTATVYGKKDTRENTDTTTFGKTVGTEDEITTEFGKTIGVTDNGTTTFGKTVGTEDETVYNSQVARTGSTTHGEEIEHANEGEHTIHAYGNIGVTTTQQLIKEQREVERFNIYDFIINDFKMRFCVLIY